jgi:SAM-dependent methyltransferase
MTHDWKTSQLTQDYLEGVRGGIPLVEIQAELIIRLIRAWRPSPGLFVDLGCGDGVLGKQLLVHWPDSNGIFIDYSEPMLQEARKKLWEYKSRSRFHLLDFSNKEWINHIDSSQKIDAVISGFSIHHIEDDKKIQVYRDIYHLLKPGGLFLNLEHVASPDNHLEKMFDEIFIDSLCSFHQKNNSPLTRQKIMEKYYNREDQVLNKTVLVETQCDWLREIGYERVDCYFKLFEIALFGGYQA